jgi:hypothetical protein
MRRVVLGIGFVVIGAAVASVLWEFSRGTRDRAASAAEAKQREAQLAREAQKFSNVDLTPGMTLAELKNAFQDPKVIADPAATQTENEAIAQFLHGAVQAVFFWPDCRKTSSSLDRATCDAVRPIEIAVRRPFSGTVLGLRIEDLSPETVRAALRQRVHAVEHRAKGGWDLFLFALPRRCELGHWTLNGSGIMRTLRGDITLTDRRYTHWLVFSNQSNLPPSLPCE